MLHHLCNRDADALVAGSQFADTGNGDFDRAANSVRSLSPFGERVGVRGLRDC